MRVIDLIPPDVHARRDTGDRARNWARRLGLFALAGALLFAVLYWLVEGRKSELISLTDRHGWLQERLQRAESLLEERERLARAQEAIALITNDRTAGWLMGTLESTMTPDTYLRSLVIERCPPPDPGVETPEGETSCVGSMKVHGIAPGHKQVGHLIQELITSDVFAEVALVSAREAGQPRLGNQVEFEILCILDREGSMPTSRGYGALQTERLYE